MHVEHLLSLDKKDIEVFATKFLSKELWRGRVETHLMDTVFYGDVTIASKLRD